MWQLSSIRRWGPQLETPCTGRWDTGNPQYVSRSDGRTVSLSADSATNYSAPMSISTESYSQSVTYNSWLGITSTTGANGEQLSMTYDSTGRPLTGTSAYGGVTTYTYSPFSSAPPLWQQESGADGVTKTTLDGMGRPIRVERGDSSGTKSIVDTVYQPCACSPLGKIQEVSQPYAPGGTPVWTVYTYDGLGRTVSVLQPDGASITKYSYSGNTTTVTDPAGEWKTFTKDVLGNLTTVVEPDPSNRPGGTLTTTYTYDWMNHVSGVTMTRAGTTQTRSFIYNDAGLLTSATNPENGTVNYYYRSDNTLWYKHDAKGQDTVYRYDGQNRLYMIQRYPQGQANSEDVCQRTTYAYGTNPSAYNYGRLVSAQTSPGGYCVGYGTAPIPSYGESYTYNAAGGVASKSIVSNMFRVGLTPEYSPLVTYGYDSYGRSTTVRYPIYSDLLFTSQNNASNIPTTFTTSYDSMGRPTGMTDDRAFAWVQNGTYDYAGRPQSMQILSTAETRAYNASGQLSSIGWETPGFAHMTGGMSGGLAYIYSTTQNNGQIQQMVDTVSGETIAYQYDALKRLTSASSSAIPGSSAASWTETFGYDGFGNLTGKTLNGILQSIPVVAQSNRLSSAVYDANGNMTSGAGATLTYNVDNRMISAAEGSGGIEYYEYAPDGKRVWRQRSSGIWEFTFYGSHGERLGVYSASAVLPGCACIRQEMNVLFAGKLIWQGVPNGTVSITGTVLSDRLGSNRNGARFYPYGDEISSTANDRMKFGTYTRDSYTGLDYADQRFYASTYGRFATVDVSMENINPADPLSWNSYAYTEGDPINFNDPLGLLKCSDAFDSDSGKTLGTEILANNDAALLGRVDWAESDGGQANGFQTQDYFDEKEAVAVSIMNRVDILNYRILISNGSGGYLNPVSLGWGPVNASLTQVLDQAGQYASVSGGNIDAAFQKKLTTVLSEDATSHDCINLANSYQAGLYATEHILQDPFASEGLTTSFHHGTATGSLEPYFGAFQSPNNFFGIPGSNVVYNPTGAPPPRPSRPTRPRPPQGRRNAVR